MLSSRNLVLVVLVLLVGGGGLAIWNAERHVGKTPEAASTSQSEKPAMVGENVEFTVTEGEVKKWKLQAVKAIYNDAHTQADLTDVKGEFYDKQGAPVLKFTAPQGQYINKHNAVILTGGVVAKSLKKAEQGTDAGEMKAPKMVWDARSDRVTASGGVDMTFPEGHSVAQTCKFTLDFSNLVLEGGVSSTITSP